MSFLAYNGIECVVTNNKLFINIGQKLIEIIAKVLKRRVNPHQNSIFFIPEKAFYSLILYSSKKYVLRVLSNLSYL